MKRLKKTLNFRLKTPKSNIEDILDNPKEWAEKAAEQYLQENAFRTVKAKELGIKFAESMEGAEDD